MRNLLDNASAAQYLDDDAVWRGDCSVPVPFKLARRSARRKTGAFFGNGQSYRALPSPDPVVLRSESESWLRHLGITVTILRACGSTKAICSSTMT